MKRSTNFLFIRSGSRIEKKKNILEKFLHRFLSCFSSHQGGGGAPEIQDGHRELRQGVAGQDADGREEHLAHEGGHRAGVDFIKLHFGPKLFGQIFILV
jgi:hypothetical protein